MSPSLELLIAIPVAIFGLIAGGLMIPCGISSIVITLGDVQRIVFIDKQLSKDVDKLHSDSNCMFFASIGTRFMGYCIAYPFIRHRATTKSKKFKVLMWVNTVFAYCVFAIVMLMLIEKGLGLA